MPRKQYHRGQYITGAAHSADDDDDAVPRRVYRKGMMIYGGPPLGALPEAAPCYEQHQVRQQPLKQRPMPDTSLPAIAARIEAATQRLNEIAAQVRAKKQQR